MKMSARNTIPGTIKNVKIGQVGAEVTINVAPGVDIVSVITATSAATLGLKQGGKAYAVIKASSVMIAVD